MTRASPERVETSSTLVLEHGQAFRFPKKSSFTVGICATGESAERLSELLQVITHEVLPPDMVLARIVVVASSPSQSAVDLLVRVSEEDPRVLILLEPRRSGKIVAVNSIIENSEGSYLVFVNADALPERGAIAKVLERIASDPLAGAVSARPTFRPSGDVTSRVIDLMWRVHNACSTELNRRGMGNHASDELMVVRGDVLSRVPTDVVNDGAYIAGHAFGEGYRILFSADAEVQIDVPETLSRLIEQRRRILFGHTQVWTKLGRPPLTLESLVLVNPILSMRILGRVVATNPRSIMILPLAVVVEGTAALLALADRLLSSDRHTIWRRSGDGLHPQKGD